MFEVEPSWVGRRQAMRYGRLLLLVAPIWMGACADPAESGGIGPEDSGRSVRLRSVARGLSAPLMVTQAPDDPEGLFVVDQVGTVMAVESDGSPGDEPFLDVSDRLVEIDPGYDERGLLGMAFHPDYSANRRVFVYYSAPLREEAPDGWDHTSHIAEFHVLEDRRRVDDESERIVLQVDQPYPNHNAGQIAFGPDGYLYVPLGDGGNGGDVDAEGDDLGRPQDGNGQTPETLLGSILRIDVDAEPYAIPSDNPQIRGETSEVFAYGFRNPYGVSFDRESGDLYVADAGQARYEEVSRVTPGGNYGWNIKEGTHCFDPNDFLNPPPDCPDTGAGGEPLLDPVIEYQRGPESGSVIVPGVRYRGEHLAQFQGEFIFGDYATIRYIPTGILYAATPAETGLWPISRVSLDPPANEPGDFSRFFLGVNQDREGELYLLTTRQGGPTGDSGEVFVIEPGDDTGRQPVVLWMVTAAIVVLGIAAGVLMGRIRRNRAPPVSGQDT